MTTPAITDLVSAVVVAERFGVTVPTVRRWVREGRIACIRPSRRVMRFRLSDVERVLTDGNPTHGDEESHA
jgi:excisionase family DNA binding protein